MSPERWERLQAIVKFLMEADAADRPGLIQGLCGDDATLRQDVLSLLEANAEAGAFLEGSASCPKLPETESDPGARPARIGLYRIVGEIGSGGMGVLYEALREGDFQKKVAIKVIKRGMDSEAIVRRFERERQILAGLNHPYITALLDGGTTEDGRPFFVMEYVEGKPLNQYCDERRLSTRERLQLFRAICAAVRYAHQNLVVHRDLKPGNILVTPDGNPKLLDFGIATILNLGVTSGAAKMTVASQRLMTPEYASPEQVRGEPVTTATDVYSLGVILYELLTGRQPYRFKTRTPQEVAEVICTQEPEKPSTAVSREEAGPAAEFRGDRPEQLRKRLRGDLDNVVLKALDKDVHRRYSSVDQFDEDIRRHLASLPVIARPDTTAYRVAKFIRRNRGAVGAAALVAASLVAGLIGTAWQARKAAQARETAERRFEDVRGLAHSLVFEFHDAIRDLPGSTPARELLIRRAVEYLDRLSADSRGNDSLQLEVARGYERLASVYGEGSTSGALGDTTTALQHMRKAVAIRERLLARNPNDYDTRRGLATAYRRLAKIFEDATDPNEGLQYAKKALALCDALRAERPQDARVQAALAGVHRILSMAMINSGDYKGALDYRRKALAIHKELLAKDPGNPDLQANVSSAQRMLAGLQTYLHQYADGLQSYRAALAIDEALVRQNPTDATTRMAISYELSDIGYIYNAQKQWEMALEHYNRALAIRQELAAADPKNANAQFALANTRLRIGIIQANLGQPSAAFENYRRAIEIREGLVKLNPASTRYQIELANDYLACGSGNRTLAKSTNRKELWRAGRMWSEKALQIYEGLAAKGLLPNHENRIKQAKDAIAESDSALRKASVPRPPRKSPPAPGNERPPAAPGSQTPPAQ